MLKVIIADDEEDICRLIHALVDWESMGMEVVGIAGNGMEAIELVDELAPDILITDIRMPGCNGLELIKHVKTTTPMLEVIIISGYAHFPYAQTAMKYGVGNYLLKPINKTELIQTLQKLLIKIESRIQSETGIEKLIQSNQSAKRKMKETLLKDLLEDKLQLDSKEVFAEEYELNIKTDLYQTFCLKLDCPTNIMSENTMKIVYEKSQDIIKGNLQNACEEILFEIEDCWGYGILNFENGKQEDVRRILRYCLNQLVVQKSILGPVEFTLATDSVIRDTKKIGESLKRSRELIKERIVVGTERMIENQPKECGLRDKNLLESYSRMLTQVIDLLSETESQATIDYLKNSIVNMKNIRGYEVLETIISAGTIFLMQVNIQDQKERLEDFQNNCEQIGTMPGLFAELQRMQSSVLNTLKDERENDSLRSIRLAKKYIQNHYNEQITLEEVSDVVGLSSSYFSVLFKKEIGEGFAKYLIGIRIDEAKKLLRESNISVAAICKEVGYNDVKHFTHTFEKITGLKPSAYRKLYG